MSLTGNLEVFPLEEVLRLLARSRKTGCLRLETSGSQGRVFLAGGSLTLATTVADDDFRRQLFNSGLVSEEDLRRIDVSDAALPEVLAPGVSTAALTDFVREHVVESLYRIRRPGRGSFDFAVDLAPRYPTGQSFDVEVALTESDRRMNEWADIESVVTDLHAPIRMARHLPDENNVTVSPTTWEVLAALQGGASVVQLAESLGLSEFRAAREMAGLFRNRLVEYVQEPVAVPEHGWFTHEEAAPTRQVEPAPAWESSPWDRGDDTEEAEPQEQPVEEHDAGRGWWSDEPQERAETPQDSGETEDFLASVFSDVDENGAEAGEQPEEEDETGFSMGLLRRRRMGTMARDVGDTDH